MIKTIFDIPDDHRIIIEDAASEDSDSRGMVYFFEETRQYTLRSKPPPEKPGTQTLSLSS